MHMLAALAAPVACRPAPAAAAAAAARRRAADASRPLAASRSRQQQAAQQLQQRPGRRCLTAPRSSGDGGGGGNDEEGEQVPPSAAEVAEAEAMLRDFLEGMGAAGEVPSRPTDMDLPEGRMSYADAVRLVGTSGWRLHGKLCAEIEELVTQMEGIWRAALPEDQFGLYELPERFRYLDSLDPEGADPFSFRDVQDPEKGAAGYPRLQIENRAYRSRALRKLHIEVAVRQDGLQVFHCVLFPRLAYDLPILSMDLVASGGRVSLAIVDPCPLTPDLRLPPFYEQPVRELQAKYGLESNREVPDWGKAIFSPLCVIMRPQSPQELGSFLKYALALTNLHVQIAKIAHPVPASQARRLAALHAAHERYCAKQLENDKTRRVLEAAFGSGLAEAYMREVMFDVEPLTAVEA